jgi:flagella basal body P-ring formation protein FlgA
MAAAPPPPDHLAAARTLIAASKDDESASWLEVFLLLLGLIMAAGLVAAGCRPTGVVVAARDIRRGDVLHTGDLAIAPLWRLSDTFVARRSLEGLVAARDIAIGQPLHSSDVAHRHAAGPGELEIPLRIHIGDLRPAAGTNVLLVAVVEDQPALIIQRARVLSSDPTSDPASIIFALPTAEALALGSLRSPEIHLLKGPDR